MLVSDLKKLIKTIYIIFISTNYYILETNNIEDSFVHTSEEGELVKKYSFVYGK